MSGAAPRRGPGAHPRVCGENAGLLGSDAGTSGSPPRVRGKQAAFEVARGDGGLTPACAGKTITNADNAFMAGAHPRVCGENRARDRDAGASAGSPPRVRGKRRFSTWAPWTRGLTPACAGKTLATPAMLVCLGAHPRVCGENVRAWSLADIDAGSPPRVRGKRTRAAGVHPPRGLTPACAGKTPSGEPRPCGRGAHPRVCGENAWSGAWSAISGGSPPRVRGKRALHSWVWGEASRPAVMRSMRSL